MAGNPGREGWRSITGEHLIGDLDRLAAERGGFPAVLRCDNGPELACGAMADWAAGQIGLHFISPGEPWRNGYVESFNSRIPDECLSINSFWSLTQARVVITDWNTTTTTAAFRPGLPTPSSLGCHLYPPMNDSRSLIGQLTGSDQHRCRCPPNDSRQ